MPSRSQTAPRALLCLALTCAVLPACQRSAAAEPIEWREPAPGLAYAEVPLRTQPLSQPIAVHLLRLDPQRWQLRVVPASLTGRPLADAAAFRRALPGAVLAINGGYFDENYRPLGLLVDRGRTLSPLRHVDHGVFAVAAGKASLVHARDWQSPPDLDFAVECGPRLIVDGKPLSFKENIARRTALGIDRHGNVVVVATADVLTLQALAQFLARSEAAGGPGLLYALNLDGGPSTMLDVERGAVHAAVRAPTQVPIGLAVVERPAP